MSVYLHPKARSEELRVKVDILAARPNKEKNIKARYERGHMVFSSAGNRIAFEYANGVRQSGVLSEIKYVRANMMVLELLLGSNSSIQKTTTQWWSSSWTRRTSSPGSSRS